MKVVKTIRELRGLLASLRGNGPVGFVPTMGSLHEGHLSLIRKSREACGCTVVSIFVNPTQFGPHEDFIRYPRDIPRDLALIGSLADIVFIPGEAELYPPGASTWVTVEGLSGILEGGDRPGHFRGVCTVVMTLFHIVMPDSAYFGWKDAQQLIIIRAMARDLAMRVRIVGMPTVRDPDGLAVSSRNVRLSPADRSAALCLSRSLHHIREMVELTGIRKPELLLAEGKKIIAASVGVELQYLEIADREMLRPVNKADENAMVLGAIRVGGVRLIDNIFL